nr:hypothetical protein [Tanacetum cinerariifolium]
FGLASGRARLTCCVSTRRGDNFVTKFIIICYIDLRIFLTKRGERTILSELNSISHTLPQGYNKKKIFIVDYKRVSHVCMSKVQEEIGKEFAAIMASRTIRASVAATLATKKEMQGYGHIKAPQS